MQRKPGFPVANCNIKMPDCPANMEYMISDDDSEQQQRRQQLINFGHTQWGFNNWSWSVTKQELDFVDFANGKYCAGVVAFVSITVKSFDIHRENIGYATSVANTKGMAIYKSRKGAVTNALRETLFSFGGSVATELTELGDGGRPELEAGAEPPVAPGLAPGPTYRPPEPKNSPVNKRNDAVDSGCADTRLPVVPLAAPLSKSGAPPAGKLHAMVVAPPMVAARPAPVARPPPAPRPNSNEALKTGMEDMSEEEARAERKRRQRQAQEEFRLKLNMKHNHDEIQDLSKGSGIDEMLMDLPTQDIVEDEEAVSTSAGAGKRKSPIPNHPSKRRGSVFSKLDIVQN